jgi:hypothetical protein
VHRFLAVFEVKSPIFGGKIYQIMTLVPGGKDRNWKSKSGVKRDQRRASLSPTRMTAEAGATKRHRKSKLRPIFNNVVCPQGRSLPPGVKFVP